MNKKAIFFDMDGTLIDGFKQQENVTFTKLEYKAMLKINKLTTRSFKAIEDLFEQDEELYAHKDELLARLISMMKQHYDEATLRSGAREFLIALKEKGYKLCLCTNNAIDMCHHILKQKNLEHIFTHMITSQDIKKGKPDPEVYEKTVSLCGYDKEECIVFEDSPQGVEAAKSAGLDVCIMGEEYQDYNDPRLIDMFLKV